MSLEKRATVSSPAADDLESTLEAPETLEQFFAVSLDLLCIADTEGRFIRVNPAFEETLGWRADELTSAPYIDFVHPDDVTATREAASELAAGQAIFTFENRYRCKDGSYRWLHWKSAPIGNYVIASARDVTEQRCTAAALNRRLAELDDLNRELEAFTYSVSHDLRAPLRHIAGFAMMVERSAAERLDPEERRRLRVVIDGADRLGRLIDDLLSFSRMSRTAVSQQAVDLDELVRDVHRELAAVQGERLVQWRIGSLPVVQGDPAMLRQVFANLIANALKYSRYRPETCIDIEAAVDGDHAVVSVRDNGVGFDMQYAHKLFGVFQRLHSADDFEGTGIGLASVRRIVERHGGRTWAEGAIDEGATFYVALPRQGA